MARIVALQLSRVALESPREQTCRKGVYFRRTAFLSTAAPRRGIISDPEQQPSPKLFLSWRSRSACLHPGSARSTDECRRDITLVGEENHHGHRSLGFVP